MRASVLFASSLPVVLLAVACGGGADDDQLFSGGASGSSQAGSSAAGSGTSGSGTSGSGTAGSGTAGSGTSGSGTAGSGTAGSGTAGTGTAGTGTAGSGTAGTGTAGSGTSGSGTSGSGTSGSGTAGSGTSGSGTAGTGTAGTGTAGTGAGGSPNLCAGVSCTQLDGPCTLGACQPTTGKCIAQARPAGTPCNDGNLCSGEDKCDGAGMCKGTPKSCAGQNGPCQVGVCEPQSGQCLAANLPDGSSCNDGDPTTDGDACVAGKCAGKPVLPPLRLVEVSTDKDFFVLQNVAPAGGPTLDLGGFTVFIDNLASASEPAFSINLPAGRKLAPGQKVYVIEVNLTAAAGDIKDTHNFFFTGEGGGVWLCQGPCTSGVVVDAFEMGDVQKPLATPYSFAPAIPADLNADPTFLRVLTAGTSPAFLSSDWEQGSPSRAF